MKDDPSAYKGIQVSDRHKYRQIMAWCPELGNLVHFQNAMNRPVHRWFYYKQAFSPEIVKNLINRLEPDPDDTIIDPFVGIGTTLLASKAAGFNSIGFDISPLAVFVSNVKLREYSQPELEAYKAEVLDEIPEVTDLPDEYYLEQGFTESKLRKLVGLKRNIMKIGDSDTRSFYMLALLSILDDVSHTRRDGAFLRYTDGEDASPVVSSYESKLDQMLNDVNRGKSGSLHRYTNDTKKEPAATAEVADARSLPAKSDTADLAITSPPYLNRYDYTRIYALELSFQFLSDEELKSLRSQTIKSHVEAESGEAPTLESDFLDIALQKMSNRELNNDELPEMVEGYFDDMYLWLTELDRVLTPGSHINIIVSNSRFEGVHIEVDSILCDIAQQLGMQPQRIAIARNKGSSAQQIKEYGDEAIRESVITVCTEE